MLYLRSAGTTRERYRSCSGFLETPHTEYSEYVYKTISGITTESIYMCISDKCNGECSFGNQLSSTVTVINCHHQLSGDLVAVLLQSVFVIVLLQKI